MRATETMSRQRLTHPALIESDVGGNSNIALGSEGSELGPACISRLGEEEGSLTNKVEPKSTRLRGELCMYCVRKKQNNITPQHAFSSPYHFIHGIFSIDYYAFTAQSWGSKEKLLLLFIWHKQDLLSKQAAKSDDKRYNLC